MARALAPLWLSTATRFAGNDRRRAVILALLLALAVAIGFSALAGPDPTDASVSPTGDFSLYNGVIDGLRAGGDYYDLTAQALRAGGYPLKPFTAFRLPTHAVVQAALPSVVTIALLYLLTIAVAAAWWVRLRAILVRLPARLSAAILLAAGLIAVVQTGGAGSHDVWVALLVALALALRTSERWVTSVALGLIAMLMGETAVLLPLVMAAFAWREGARRELAGWGLALLAFAAVLAAHSWGVSRVVGPLDLGSPAWLGPSGVGGVIRALVDSTALQFVPLMLAAPLVIFALFGWTAWRDPLAERVLALFACQAAMIALVPMDSLAWGLMQAPMLLVGLVFTPDTLRDLGAALLDRRRVRVQRISQ